MSVFYRVSKYDVELPQMRGTRFALDRTRTKASLNGWAGLRACLPSRAVPSARSPQTLRDEQGQVQPHRMSSSPFTKPPAPGASRPLTPTLALNAEEAKPSTWTRPSNSPNKQASSPVDVASSPLGRPPLGQSSSSYRQGQDPTRSHLRQRSSVALTPKSELVNPFNEPAAIARPARNESMPSPIVTTGLPHAAMMDSADPFADDADQANVARNMRNDRAEWVSTFAYSKAISTEARIRVDGICMKLLGSAHSETVRLTVALCRRRRNNTSIASRPSRTPPPAWHLSAPSPPTQHHGAPLPPQPATMPTPPSSTSTSWRTLRF